VTLKASHAVNLAFQFGAFTFADRPLASATTTRTMLGSKIVMATDPVTGMSLRLEVTRQNKQTQWSFDHLYGAKLRAARLRRPHRGLSLTAGNFPEPPHRRRLGPASPTGHPRPNQRATKWKTSRP
jgi:hypothetical protein